MIRSGMLDRSAEDELGPNDLDTADHRQLAFEAGADAMVLLKNDGGILPLTAPPGGGPLKVALVGPHIDSTVDLLSSAAYSGENHLVQANSIAAAFARRAAAGTAPAMKISGTAAGCDITMGCGNADLGAVAAATADADVVLAFVGLHPSSGAPTVPGCVHHPASSRSRASLRTEPVLKMSPLTSWSTPSRYRRSSLSRI